MIRGYSLLEMLLALWICLSIVWVLPAIYGPLLHWDQTSSQLDIVIALYQLSEDVHLAETIEVDEHELRLYDVNGKQDTISLHQGRLVCQPGFNIYLHNIDAVSFEVFDEILYMYLERGETSERYEIASIKRYGPEEWLCDDGRAMCDCESDDPNDDPESNPDQGNNEHEASEAGS